MANWLPIECPTSTNSQDSELFQGAKDVGGLVSDREGVVGPWSRAEPGEVDRVGVAGFRQPPVQPAEVRCETPIPWMSTTAGRAGEGPAGPMETNTWPSWPAASISRRLGLLMVGSFLFSVFRTPSASVQ